MSLNPLNEKHPEQVERPLNVISILIVDQKMDDAVDKKKLMAAHPNQLIDKISLGKLLDKFYREVSESLDGKNIKWEAELELGIEFGVNVKAKIKICPKDQNT